MTLRIDVCHPERIDKASNLISHFHYECLKLQSNWVYHWAFFLLKHEKYASSTWQLCATTINISLLANLPRDNYVFVLFTNHPWWNFHLLQT